VNNETSARLSVFVAVRLIDSVAEELATAFDATFSTSDDPMRELSESDVEFDAVLFSLDLPMRGDAIRALPEQVRALATYSVGTDHIDLEAAKARGLAVFNTPGVLADSVAENAIFLMLGAARRATESIELVRSRKWPGWNPTQLVGFQLLGRTLGILGMGDIGLRVATRARALGMEILYSNRNRLPPSHPYSKGFRTSASELVEDCDVLLLACPSTEATRGVVDATLLSRARPGLIVVNIARGDLVDDAALTSALREGRVWAAGLDVFAGEPNLNPAYFDLPNVFMLPHIGSSTLEARVGMGRILIEALESWQLGRSVSNRVC
jgi:lactate dehydrogenase-like 2-hydroxyacid dehydrogenase